MTKACVIVPAYKEAPNLTPLVERIFAAVQKDSKLKGFQVEVIVVDDNSRDGSVEAIEALQAKGYNARIIVRTKERGLSSAVLHGFKECDGDLLLCMDADLQHPPEKVPAMIVALSTSEYVLGTRYGETFDVDKSWPMHRVIMSKGARLLARPLSPLSDPMSGFFGITRQAFKRGRSINQRGFKIALELFVKCGVRTHKEVHIHFSARTAGESKLDSKVMVNYLLHLFDLYTFAYGVFIAVLLLVILFALYSFFTTA